MKVDNEYDDHYHNYLFTFVEDVSIGVLGDLLRQTVEENVRRLISTTAAGRIAEEFIQRCRLALCVRPSVRPPVQKCANNKQKEKRTRKRRG